MVFGGKGTEMDVWVLHHVHELPDGEEDVKLIGIYSSEEAARLAISRLSRQPGFQQVPSGFQVESYEVDKDHWSEGFVTV